ncbi:MAG TPA: alpha/beta fold hydrolase [Acidimicrobiia bacterium]
MTDLLDPLAGPFRYEGSNGEAAVLVHGFTGVPAHFRPMAQVLADAGYTVVAPLLAGHGTSIEDLAETGRDDWIESVRDAHRSVEAAHDRVHFVGLSMGGLISIIVAAEVGAATISTINSPISFRDKKARLSRLLHPFMPEVRWPEEEPPDMDDEVAPFFLTYPGFPTKALADLVSISRRALRTAPEVGCPALVVQSLVDESVDPKSGAQLARAFGPGTPLVWLKTSRHNALLDRERDTIHQAVLDRFASESRARFDIVSRP